MREESTGGIFLDGGGVEQIFGWRGKDSPIPFPSRENSAIQETKLVHKTKQNYNRLNYKMYYKSAIMHKNRIFLIFKIK